MIFLTGYPRCLPVQKRQIDALSLCYLAEQLAEEKHGDYIWGRCFYSRP